MFQLDLHGRQPIYEQLKQKISRLVLSGELKPGDPLPSVRGFARELGVNPNTVQKAYQELERDNLICTISGRGSFVHWDLQPGSHLRESQVKAIRLAVLQAKALGITRGEALQAVDEIYKEEESNDQNR